MAVETVAQPEVGYEEELVHGWIVDRLVNEGGFSADDADLLASTPGLDYRVALAMVGHGCPHAKVLYILT